MLNNISLDKPAVLSYLHNVCECVCFGIRPVVCLGPDASDVVLQNQLTNRPPVCRP